MPKDETTSFYKIIFEQLDLQKMKIPSKFMRTHGDDLSNTIYLCTPNGKEWKINLIRENGAAFLQNDGWPEFVKFYSLNVACFLVFKYKGNSRFSVNIMDPSCSEIEYPLHLQNKGKREEDIMDDKLIISYNIRYKGLNVTSEERNRVCAYAACHCYKPSFAAKMAPSHVGFKFALGVPKEFVRRYLDSKCLKLNLETCNNYARKSWAVATHGCSRRMSLSAGWKSFVLDNKLRVGDICIFELIHKQKLKVHILRADSRAKVEVHGRTTPPIKTQVQLETIYEH